MTALEEITQAINTLERLKAEASEGPWYIDPDERWLEGPGFVVMSSNYPASIEPGDAELIVVLYRTIDAQLAILRREGEFALKFGWPEQPFPERLDVLTLARAINGATS